MMAHAQMTMGQTIQMYKYPKKHGGELQDTIHPVHHGH
jgi:hypothetical protein